jgi:drug/metabolite transporter (DMT)-like permease
MPLHRSSGHWQLGLSLSLLTMFLWGVLPIALTVVLQTLDIYTLTWFRFLVSFTLLALYLARRGQLPHWQKLLSPDVLKLLAVSTLFLGSNYLLFVQGLAQTSPATAEVLMQCAPVLLSLGGLVIFKECYTLGQWLGVGVLSLGMTLFFHQQLTTLLSDPTRYLWGGVLVILSSAAWTTYAMCQKQLLQKLASSDVLLVIYGGCTALFSLVLPTPIAAPERLFTLGAWQWGALIFCALNTVLAYGAFAESLEHLEASRVSAILTLTPVVTIGCVLVMPFVDSNFLVEPITALALFGAALVVVGSLAIALGKPTSSPS